MPDTTDLSASAAESTNSNVPVSPTTAATELLEPARVQTLPGDAEFALCLTHDVDRPYKGIRSLYYATQDRPAYHLRSALDRSNPYWQFEEIMELEAELGVRSAFYFLNEQHLLADRSPREWLSPANWVQHLGRYDVTAPEIIDVIQTLDEGGWEVGLHGSYHTATDRERLREEKTLLESVLEKPIRGGRQHHLRLENPETWHHHRAIGLEYDASLGSSTECGFHEGYHPVRPFGDEFVVFPLTVMDQALPDPATTFDAAQRTCERLLLEAMNHGGVMTVLWHPRFFNEQEYPGHRALYRWVVERALELGAWVGSPGEFCTALELESERERTREREHELEHSTHERPQSSQHAEQNRLLEEAPPTGVSAVRGEP
ncbi:polysaccharide deacetylase family protein [Natronolimnobius sp. AArcel1]|uniref:polysaccharide deacetylase family protein n=1 Tax=Natronolimnobius sp. AArcel1 TaxID=1679093 RepID=UPI001F14CA40|nr:polysaccharide deacetylase family protein [Natronolimnobius sp. AArcel1]